MERERDLSGTTLVGGNVRHSLSRLLKPSFVTTLLANAGAENANHRVRLVKLRCKRKRRSQS